MIRSNWLLWMYLGFAFMVSVPAVVSYYYHTRVRRLTTGRALRNAQGDLAPRHGNIGGNLANAAQIWRRVQSGEFGEAARRLVVRCNLMMAAWAVVLVIWFGILLYAEEQVKAQGGWPDSGAGARSADRDP